MDQLLKSTRSSNRRRALTGLSRTSGKRSVLTLVAVLSGDKDSDLRLAAADALGQVASRNKSVDQSLILALRDRSSLVRGHAALSLGHRRAKKAIPKLVELLATSRDSLVRTSVAETLGEIGGRRAFSALVEALNDRSWMVRGYAAQALAEIGGQRAVPALIRRRDVEKSSWVKLLIYAALYRLGEANYLPTILGMFRSRPYHVRCAIANILAEIADEKNRDLILPILRTALRKESTMAARSSISNALRCVRQVRMRSGTLTAPFTCRF